MKKPNEHDDSPGVTELISGMTHPLKPTIEALRHTILNADSTITEGIKWKSPSFYNNGWFLTIGSRKPQQLEIVFHCGAKVQANCTVREEIEDPGNLLSWPSNDRALLILKSQVDFEAKRAAFQHIVKKWATYQKRHATTSSP